MSKTGEYVIKLREEQLLDMYFIESLIAFKELEEYYYKSFKNTNADNR